MANKNQRSQSCCRGFLEALFLVFLMSFSLLWSEKEEEVTKTLCAARKSNNVSDIVMDHIKSALDSAVTEQEEMREDQRLPKQDEEYTYQVFPNHKTFNTHFK